MDFKIDLQMFGNAARGRTLASLTIDTHTMTYTKGDLTINNALNEIDVSDDSADYDAVIAGNRKVTISGTVNYQSTLPTNDQAVQALLIASQTGVTVAVVYKYETLIAAGSSDYTGTAIVTSFNISKADPQTVSFGLTLTDAPTIALQSA